MRRSVKYGLYGAVLAGVVGGTAAFATAANGTPITVVVDGQTKSINTSASDVQGALKTAGYRVGAHDIVAPDLHAKIADGSKVALNAVTVEVLDQLGWLDESQRQELEPWRSRDIFSVRGAKVGKRRSAFRLKLH